MVSRGKYLSRYILYIFSIAERLFIFNKSKYQISPLSLFYEYISSPPSAFNRLDISAQSTQASPGPTEQKYLAHPTQHGCLCVFLRKTYIKQRYNHVLQS